jgi:flavin-dependent dehydrogenase
MPTALIIGAGPAGSMAAIALRRLGWTVTLVEQHRFPRDKVCGECLSAIGFDVLNRSGLSTRFLSAHPVRLVRTIFHTAGGATISTPLPRPMWGISRRVFDQLLLEEARRCGSTILQPARCESVEPTRAVVRDLQSNIVQLITADCILLADGKCAFANTRPALTGDLGIKLHFENVTGPRDAVELFALPGHYGGLAPINGNLWNAAFSVPQHRLQFHRGNLESLLHDMTHENVGLAHRLRHAERVGPVLTSPLPRFPVANRFPIGIIPIGNAAAALEPIGGEGMGLALRSAELAATWIDSRHRADLPLDYSDLAPCFNQLWKTKRLAYRTAALLTSHRTTSSIAVDFLSSTFGQQSLTSTLKFLLAQDAGTVQ